MNCVTTTIAKMINGRTAERNGRLGKHGREIRNRQRFPKQNAAIATFAVQRIETVKDADDERGEDHHHRRDVVGRSIAARCFAGSSNNTACLRSGRPDRADEKPNNDNAGDDQRRDVNRMVLPQFAPHRPVEWPRPLTL